MRKQWVLLIGLVVAFSAFAEENIDPPFSTDSLRYDLTITVRVKVSPSSDQVTLMDWLRAALGSPQQQRVVIDSKVLDQNVSDSAEANRSVLIPWEESAVLYWEGEQVDSLLISASRTGCPGTEVRESVAVSFATQSGWSYPPIRFGPLGEHVICPLGEGLELKVLERQEAGPVVQLEQHEEIYGSR